MGKLKEIADKWEKWENILQAGSLVGLLAGIFLLESVGKETAREIVWYWAIAEFTLATVAFIVSKISTNKRMMYLRFQSEKMKLTRRINGS